MTTLAHRVVARSIRIDQNSIQQLRKEFLALAKNIPRVKDEKDLNKLRDGFKVFRNRFNRIFFDEWLNKQFKYDDSIRGKSWHEKQLREIGWTFYIELSFPSRFWEERKQWDNRLKAKARPLWKALQSFIDEQQGSYDIETTQVENLTLEGFKVRVIGNPEDGRDSDALDRFKESLRIFRKNVSKVFPPMLRVMLPMHLIFETTLDESGRYHGRFIEIYLGGGHSSDKNPNRWAQVIAHEMGHHLWKVFLGKNDQTFWDEAIRGNYAPMTPMDIQRALKIWPDGAWLYEMPEKLKDVDPTLALQLQLIGWGHGGRREMNKKEDFEKALERGESIVVPKNPITGYAGKNSEEAFCEAIGMLVGYGPRTVDPLIKSWLHMILPGVRVATMAERVAARYKEKKISDKGNPIYLYSERQVALRNKKKAERLEKLGKGLKKLRAQVKQDLKSSDPETRLTALAVALMDHTYERVGNDSSASDGHFGVTGWQRKHMSFGSGGTTIKYVGKSGVKQEKKITDAGIRKALKDAYDGLKGDDTCVLSWDDGCVTADKVNSYLKPFEVTAKDIRGYHANEEMRKALKQFRKGTLPSDKKEREKKLKEEFKQALEMTAKAVGHESATLKNQYLVPGLEDNYLKDGSVT